MAKEQQIKCLVWDLDNTLWKGTLIEDTHVTVDPAAVQLIKTLDERGILQSVASKNDADLAMNKLNELGLAEYFLYPQIHWDSKSGSIQSIANEINIGIDSIAFIDDQAYEREEVAFHHPQVMTIDTADLHTVAHIPQMIPRFITDDSRIRRQMYQSDIKRKEVEDSYSGAQDEFLSTLDMELIITRAQPDDLRRAEELTQRTNQLNTTAYTYDYDELEFFSTSPNYILLVAGLTDKYGTYGKIGLVLIEKTEHAWVIKLLLMSCRVMSRGVGSVLITYIRNLAAQNEARLHAEFVSNDRNRMMYMTYKFNQFKEIDKKDNWSLLENDLSTIPPYPSYMVMKTDTAAP